MYPAIQLNRPIVPFRGSEIARLGASSSIKTAQVKRLAAGATLAFAGVSPAVAVDSNSIHQGCGASGGLIGDGGVAIGGSCHVASEAARANGALAVGIGYNAQVQNAASKGSIAFGAQSRVGSDARATVGGMALGWAANVGGGADNAIALGTSSRVVDGVLNGIALGPNAKTTVNDGVALGSQSVADRGAINTQAEIDAAVDPLSYSGQRVRTLHGAVSVGASGAERQITNVAAGTEDTDAVNVGQVKAVRTVVDSNAASVAAALGGGSEVRGDGTLSAPSYTVDGVKVSSVGDAITNIDSRVTRNSSSVDLLNKDIGDVKSQLAESGIGLVQQDADTKNITVAKKLEGGRVDFRGMSKVTRPDGGFEYVPVTRVATGLSRGELSETSTDAVTGAQLFATNQDVARLNEAVKKLNAGGTGGTGGPGGSGEGSEHVTATGPNSNASGNGATSTGANSSASGNNATSTGSGSSASGENSTATGANSNASGNGATSTGANSSASGNNATSTGSGSSASGENATATGANSIASGKNSTANGWSASASRESSTALGAGAIASGDRSSALGAGAKASAADSVALGAGSVANEPNTVSVGSVGHERRITNVADGVNPTDAVNMRQFQNGISDIARKAYSGVAAASALSMIPDVDQGKTIAVGTGTANYQGYQAVALGLSARITQNLKVRAGASMTSAGTTWGVGASYQW
ncbi:YadA family autotransporter adhesin [Burkholderia ubonensis]|uniref:YadA family autotransporter adhesin n=1 Tax=Burkholderia ubonensis TaxID=101571 RepID=UPI000A8F466F|nr:YadA-like family protein [Burkholderia ubonensis]